MSIIHKRPYAAKKVAAMSIAGILLLSGIAQASPSTYTKQGAESEITSIEFDYQKVNVTIDSQLQTFEQDAVIIGESTMVPMRAIFEKLGAKIDWDQDTETVTAVKVKSVSSNPLAVADTINIKLTVGKQIAFVNSKAVSLAVKPVIINGSTLVPLRFVAEALGTGVSWDQATTTAVISSTKTALIDSSGASWVAHKSFRGRDGMPQLAGLDIYFGNHTYGSRNQEEYNKVMDIIKEASKGYNKDYSELSPQYGKYYEEYLNGSRWSGDLSDASVRNRGLKIAEGKLGALVDAGISKDIITDVHKLTQVAYSLNKNKTDPGDGSPSSAADVLLYGKIDCDASSNVMIAVLDAQGYNTAIIANTGDAVPAVQLDGKWFTMTSDSFKPLTLPTSTKPPVSKYSDDIYLYTTPTY